MPGFPAGSSSNIDIGGGQSIGTVSSFCGIAHRAVESEGILASEGLIVWMRSIGIFWIQIPQWWTYGKLSRQHRHRYAKRAYVQYIFLRNL